jgi:hypothetical protein
VPAETAEPGTEPSRNPRLTGTLPAAAWRVKPSSAYRIRHKLWRGTVGCKPNGARMRSGRAVRFMPLSGGSVAYQGFSLSQATTSAE